METEQGVNQESDSINKHNFCFDIMSEYKVRIHQMERNQRLLSLLELYFIGSKNETHLNLLRSLERAVILQKVIIHSLEPRTNVILQDSAN